MSFRLNDCADLIRNTINPKLISPPVKYIGLEHINAEDLSLNGFGTSSDVDSSKYRFSKGDILFGKLRPYFRKAIIAEFDGVCSTDIWVIRPKASQDANFLFYWISSNDFVEKVNMASEGTRMPRAKWSVASELKKPVVKNEQKIGSVLRNLDLKRSINAKINQTLESISQTLFKSWFVEFDPVRAKQAANASGEDPQLAAMQIISGKTPDELKELSDENYQRLAATADLFPEDIIETEHGEIPAGWEWKPLYDTAEYVNGVAFKAMDFSPDKNGLPIVKIAELKSGISAQTKFTLKEMPEKYSIKNGSMLYSWSGSPETSLEVFKWFGGEGWLNQHIFLINTASSSQKVFVFNLLKFLKPELIGIAKNKQTTGLGHITVADMKRLHVAYPDEHGMKLVNDYLSPLYDLDSSNTIQSENLKEQRDTLIPKLLSGELEIS